MSGSAVVSSGLVSSPLDYIDVPLLGSHDHYELHGSGLVLDGEDGLACALSPDGGSTFYNDTANADSYGNNQFANHNGALAQESFGQAAIVMTRKNPGASSGKLGFHFVMDIYPGSSTCRASVGIRGRLQNESSGKISTEINDAVLMDAVERQNLLRIYSQGNAMAANPPDGHRQITAGSWVLFGIDP